MPRIKVNLEVPAILMSPQEVQKRLQENPTELEAAKLSLEKWLRIKAVDQLISIRLGGIPIAIDTGCGSCALCLFYKVEAAHPFTCHPCLLTQLGESCSDEMSPYRMFKYAWMGGYPYKTHLSHLISVLRKALHLAKTNARLRKAEIERSNHDNQL